MSTPTNVIMAEAKVLSLEGRSGLLARRYVGRVMAYGNEGLKTTIEELTTAEINHRYEHHRRNRSIITEAWMSLSQEINKIRTDTNIMAFISDYWTVSGDTTVDNSVGKRAQHDRDIRNNIREEIIKELKLTGRTEMLYTDGSKKREDNKVGVVIFREEGGSKISFAIFSKATIFTAELVAINEAMKIIMEETVNNNGEKNYIIVTDSESAIKAIGQNDLKASTNPYIIDIRDNIMKFTCRKENRDRKVAIVWVPALMGIEGNEIADQIAKQGADNVINEEIKIPVDDMKSKHKERMTDRTNRRLERQSTYKGKFYFENFY